MRNLQSFIEIEHDITLRMYIYIYAHDINFYLLCSDG